jgi:4a-hydroxytetrahydrobiopterin dehydratase
MSQKLVGAARKTALHEIHGWAEVADRDAIRKTYHFGSFSEAWAFMSEVALLAARLDHYPEMFNSNNRVELILSTNEVEALTDLDLAFARAVDELAPRRDRTR